MKFLKTILLISVIVAVAGFAGWRVWQSKPAEPKGEQHEAEKEEHEAHGETAHVKLTPEQRKNAKIVVEKAGRAKIKSTLPLYGKIAANQEAMAHVVPRFPGVVKEVRKRLGDQVQKGDVLAVVEGNESLRTYEIVAELPGTVIEKDVTRGEVVKDYKPIFTIADLSTVWVDLNVFRQDFELLKEGDAVTIVQGEKQKPIEAKVDYISPFGAESSQTMLARCVIPNADGRLRPGLFVTAEVVTAETDAAVAVKTGAIQTLKEKTVVFVEESQEFEAREVEIGVRDREWAEVVSGIHAGDPYVAANSFMLKAELGKGEAEED